MSLSNNIMKKVYVIASLVSAAIMMIVFEFGNPSYGGFYWHFIPELFALLFMGAFFYELKFSKKVILLLYAISIVVPPFILRPKKTPVTFLDFVVSALLGFFLVLGYFFASKRNNPIEL